MDKSDPNSGRVLLHLRITIGVEKQVEGLLLFTSKNRQRLFMTIRSLLIEYNSKLERFFKFQKPKSKLLNSFFNIEFGQKRPTRIQFREPRPDNVDLDRFRVFNQSVKFCTPALKAETDTSQVLKILIEITKEICDKKIHHEVILSDTFKRYYKEVLFLINQGVEN